MTSTFTLGVIGAIVTLVVLFEMLRRQRLREKYALIWVVVAVCAVILAVFPGLLNWAADLLGVHVPSNLLLFGASMLLLIMSIQLSYEIGRVEERTRTLAEEVAILRLKVDQLPGSAGSNDELEDSEYEGPQDGRAQHPKS